MAFWCQQRKMTGAWGAQLSVLKLLWNRKRRKKQDPIYSGVKSLIGNSPASIQVHCRWPDCERHSSVWHTRQPGCDKRQFLELEIRFQLWSAITVISTDVDYMQIRCCVTSVLIRSHIGLQYISQIVRSEYMCWDSICICRKTGYLAIPLHAQRCPSWMRHVHVKHSAFCVLISW